MRAALADGKISGEQFDTAVAGTSRAHYETLFSNLGECWGEFERLDRIVDEKFGREAPSLLGLKDSIEGCRTLVERILKEKRKLEPDATPAPAVEPQKTETPERVAPVSGGLSLQPQDRADALRRLAAVAAFFRRTEPHSPVAYLVQRAVQWGDMPLEHWLEEVIKDDTVLAHVRETLGLKATEEKSGGKPE
jgi:type VI secretion system protein ImpA